MPLTVSPEQIVRGEIRLRIFAPTEYDHCEIDTATAEFPVEGLYLGGRKFTLAGIDGRGFVITADQETMNRLDGPGYLYGDGAGTYYKSSSSTNFTREADFMLNPDHRPSFGEWMARNGLDPGNLEETLPRFIQSQEADDAEDKLMGRRFDTGISGQKLLLFAPVEKEKTVAEICFPFPTTDANPRRSISEEVERELLERIRLENPAADLRGGACGQNPSETIPDGDSEAYGPALPQEEARITITEVETDISDTSDLPNIIDPPASSAGCASGQSTAASDDRGDSAPDDTHTTEGAGDERSVSARFDFSTPSDLPSDISPTAYAIVYVLAHELSGRHGVTSAEYTEHYAARLHRGYLLGREHSDRIIAQDDSSLVEELQKPCSEPERLCIYYGAQLGAYSPVEEGLTDSVDRHMTHILSSCRTQYDENSAEQYDECLYCARLCRQWTDYFAGEVRRAYLTANPPLFYTYPVSDHFADALIGDYWTDPSLCDKTPTYEQCLASALSKFEPSPIPGAIPALKDEQRLSIGERNALLAPNGRISYAMGVVQAESMVRAEESMPQERREEFRKAVTSDEGQALLFEEFAAGVNTCRELYGKYREAMAEDDREALAPMYEALNRALEKAAGQGLHVRMGFTYGVFAVQYYCLNAEWDMPRVQKAGGQNLDAGAALQGFKDFIRGNLTMGVEYARSLSNGRAVAVADLGCRAGATPEVEGFTEVKALDPMTGLPSAPESVLQQLLAKVGSDGMMVTVVVEADGAVSRVEVDAEKDAARCAKVADALFRMHCIPAMVGDVCVGRVLRLPVVF